MDDPNNLKSCSFCNMFSAIEPLMRELKRDHMRKAHAETDHQNNLNNCSFCNLFSAIEPMIREVKGDHMRKTHIEIYHPNNFKNCSFCNMFSAIEPMMRELKEGHMRKAHAETDHPKNLDNCSFCNLFSAIDPMVRELTGDHKRKTHTETESGVSKGLCEPLKINALNSARPHISEQEVKIEKAPVKEDLSGLFNEVKNKNEEFYNANNSESDQQKNFTVDNNKVDMHEKLNYNPTKSTSDKAEYDNDKINYTNYDDDDDLGLLDDNIAFEDLSKNSNNDDGVRVNEFANVTAFNDNEDIGNNESNLDRKVSKQDHDGISVANDSHKVDNISKDSQEEDVVLSMQMNKEIQMQKSKQSEVWNHFKIKDRINSLSECNYCRKVLKSTNGTTTGLRLHIRKKHPDKWNDLTFQRINKSARRKPSLVWNHFKPLLDEISGTECNYCGSRIANPNGTTTNMRSHLKRYHPVEWDPTYVEVESNERNTLTRHRQSLVWDHFKHQFDDKNRVECNYCGTRVASPNGNTTNMRGHLERKHMEKVRVKLYEEKGNMIKRKRSSENTFIEDDVTVNDYAIVKAFNNDDIEDISNNKSNLDTRDSLQDPSLKVDNKSKVSQGKYGTLSMPANKEIKMQKSKQSEVWNHFKIKDSINFLSECNYCGKMLKSTNGTTTGLKFHIRNKHPNKWNDLTFQRINKIARRKPSLVWNHFKPLLDEISGAECNYCGSRFANPNGTTSNMRCHLKRYHPVEWDPTYIEGQSNKLNTFIQRRQSLVWDHFKRQWDDKTRVNCNYCGTRMASPNGTTTNMRVHLEKRHMEKVRVQLSAEKENLIKRKRSSEIIIQEHFKPKPHTIDGRICNYCGMGISNSSRATSKMIRHLRNKHATQMKNYIERKIKEGLDLKEDENIDFHPI